MGEYHHFTVSNSGKSFLIVNRENDNRKKEIDNNRKRKDGEKMKSVTKI